MHKAYVNLLGVMLIVDKYFIAHKPRLPSRSGSGGSSLCYIVSKGKGMPNTLILEPLDLLGAICKDEFSQAEEEPDSSQF